MRVAVITGGAKRIGASIVSMLLEDGWAVIVHCNRSITQARHLIQRGKGAVVSGDLSNDDELFRVIEEIHDHEFVNEAGGIDLLIHNASIYSQTEFSKVTPQELRRFTSIHLDAPFFITQGLVPKIKAKKGSVIGIVDTSWGQSWEELSHYTATKAALRQLLLNLSGELAPDIRVNGIAPGAILAASWEKERFDEIVKNIPLRRAGEPKDIANAVKFLSEAQYITGFILPVDGGWSIS
mgnify:FL=1|tara:strand:- start:996 stop:1709 length:714 start_codon:yes stop_codon:yes gene_type:complete